MIIRLTKADAIEAPHDELRGFEDWERSLGLTCFREVEIAHGFTAFVSDGCVGCDCPLAVTTVLPPPLGEKWRGWIGEMA